MTTDPKILGLALLGGIVPALFWLWFWLKEDNNKAGQKGILTVLFILGMLSVIVVVPVNRFIQTMVSSNQIEIALWAASEEAIKCLVVLAILFKTTKVKDPVDWPIYFITAALGFAALENTLYLLRPLSLGDSTVSLITGQLRFLGSTLLHAVSTGIVGIGLGLSFHAGKFQKIFYTTVGIFFAITLHTAFNFFIIEREAGGFLQVFAFLWVITIIVMLLFEKLRRMSM